MSTLEVQAIHDGGLDKGGGVETGEVADCRGVCNAPGLTPGVQGTLNLI